MEETKVLDEAWIFVGGKHRASFGGGDVPGLDLPID